MNCAVENTLTTRVRRRELWTFGFEVLSCSAKTLKFTSSFADGLITCENAA